MDRIGHQAISASAGSGKTFQLAHRYIRLMAGGVKPERIIALTFSRKAAGEIFDSIMKTLRHAASSEQGAANTAERIGKPDLGRSDFLVLLRNILDHLHRLHIGTLDSFTVMILRSFPFELGIPSGFRLMENEDAMAQTVRQDILSEIFNNHYVNRASRNEFYEAFKQATYGKQQKGLVQNLDSFVAEYRKYFQVLPDESGWGDADRIWAQGTPWLAQTGNTEAITEELGQLLEQDNLPERTVSRWQDFLSSARSFSVHSSWDHSINYMVEKLLSDPDGLRKGNAVLPIERTKHQLSEQESHLSLQLLTHILKCEIISAIERTRGIYRVLDQYERFYEGTVRKQGKLTFDDVHYILAAAEPGSEPHPLSRLAGSESRLYIDYRMDAKLDHWLLDEFQDTSDLQWEVIENLADEIIQDRSGERSFFYVGDVKQAIYGWRGGNAQLFGKILNRYPNLIEQKTLSTSFRSCQPVIDTINQVFGRLPDSLSAGVVRRWEAVWEEHQCQTDFVPVEGYTALLEPVYSGGDKPREADLHHLLGRVIAEIDPLSRGMSTAILVRSNESGRRIVDFLRHECPHLPVIHEGKASIKDNPVVVLMLSLIKFAAHPGDTLAWRHLQMSPLNTYFETHGLSRRDLPLQLIDEIQAANGFADFIRHWGNVLDNSYQIDDFGKKRLRELIDAASEFAAFNEPDCSRFLHFIDNYQIHDSASDEAIRVMTIHQSKGLGFDIVILPDLQGDNITRAKNSDFILARNPLSADPEWALHMPRKMVAEADPTLARQLEHNDESACFDNLCLLYVALTRAKQGLYMVTSYPGKDSAATTSAAFLKTQLCGEPKPVEGTVIPVSGELFTCLFETGRRDWYLPMITREQTPVISESLDLDEFLKTPSHRPRLIPIQPSQQATYSQPAGFLFDENYHSGREFGTAVHQLFYEIRWIDDQEIDGIIRQWQEKTIIPPELWTSVIDHFRRTLEHPEVKHVLTRPEGNIELWRERRFEVVLDRRWISGTFDRVVIYRNAKGSAESAVILDFKSDELDSVEEIERASTGYRPQLALYRQALAQILSLDQSQITTQLLFTRLGKLVETR
mgnify:CR=1 FL=1